MNKIRKLILKQHQSPGDILVFAGAVGDLKRSYPDWLIDVRSPVPDIFYNNPHLTELNENDPDVEVYPVGYDKIHVSGVIGLHWSDAFKFDIEQKLNADAKMVDRWGLTKINTTGILPEIYISDEERTWYNQVHCEFLWDGPYWIINAGCKPDNVLKQYHRWDEVVAILNEYWGGKVKLVQIGQKEHIHPRLENTFDLIGKTSTRELIRLGYWAKELGGGFIGPLSFQFILSAAFHSPSVCVCGGKEGVRWQMYNFVQMVYVNGCLPCCNGGQIGDGCWKGGQKGECVDLVDGVPRCFHIITPEHIAERVMWYYEGKRLEIPAGEKWVGDVSVTPTGKTYHKHDCPNIKGRPFEIIDYKEVEKRNLTACKRCSP